MSTNEPHVALLLGDLFERNESGGFDAANLGWRRVSHRDPYKAFLLVIKIPVSWAGHELRWTVSMRDERDQVPTFDVDGETHPMSWVEDRVLLEHSEHQTVQTEYFTYRAARPLSIPGRVLAGRYNLVVDVNGVHKPEWTESFEVTD